MPSPTSTQGFRNSEQVLSVCRAEGFTPPAHLEVASLEAGAPTLGLRDTLKTTEHEARVTLACFHTLFWAGLESRSRMAGFRAWFGTQGVPAILRADQGCGGRSLSKRTGKLAVQTCKPRTREAVAAGLRVPGQPGLQRENLSQKITSKGDR